MTLRPPIEDMDQRTPVWIAMTDFFLDTALTEVTISNISEICAASPYSTRELERIMFTEVWPAFLPNLVSVAGEWAGWKEGFIKERILSCYKPRFYFSWKFNPMKRFFCGQWAAVEQQVTRTRHG